MDRIRVTGGNRLEGQIAISGAKNAALPLMVASLLTDEPLELANVPHLADIASLTQILRQHGTTCNMSGNGAGADGRVLQLQTKDVTSTLAPYDLVRKMRASFLVAGPLLARCGEATVSLPGGCAIGTRPVDLHIKGLEAMGADIRLEDGYVHAQAKQGLKGAHYVFPFVSVGATENLMMAASLARGTTILENAAREPEIVDLGHCLQAMGARIDGLGSSTITIEGVTSLRGARHTVLPDRIETGTFLMAAAITGGAVDLVDTRADLVGSLLPVLAASGIDVAATPTGLRVNRNGHGHKAIDVETEPYPGFPTDLQAQLMALLATAEGTSHIKETIFENRFMHVPELMRMGARIETHGQMATIHGVARLQGAPVMATDLRASVSLILAGLAAEGETTVSRVYHLDRGFERIEEKLGAVGAEIERLKD